MCVASQRRLEHVNEVVCLVSGHIPLVRSSTPSCCASSTSCPTLSSLTIPTCRIGYAHGVTLRIVWLLFSLLWHFGSGPFLPYVSLEAAVYLMRSSLAPPAWAVARKRSLVTPLLTLRRCRLLVMMDVVATMMIKGKFFLRRRVMENTLRRFDDVAKKI